MRRTEGSQGHEEYQDVDASIDSEVACWHDDYIAMDLVGEADALLAVAVTAFEVVLQGSVGGSRVVRAEIEFDFEDFGGVGEVESTGILRITWSPSRYRLSSISTAKR